MTFAKRQMAIRLRLLVLIVAALSIFAAAAAEDPATQVSKLVAQAQYGQAENVAETNLRQAVSRHGAQSVEAAEWIHWLGIIAKQRGQYLHAHQAFEQVLRIRSKKFGWNNAKTALTISNLALIKTKLGHWRQAERLYRNALRLNLKLHGPRHAYTVTTQSNLGLLYLDLGRVTEAQRLLSEALATTESTEGPRAANTATSLSNLAALHVATLHYAEAEHLLLRSLAIDTWRFGSEHQALASTHNSLGQLYENKGDPSKAEHHFLTAAAIDRRQDNGLNPEHAITLLNLAQLYQKAGRLKDATRTLNDAGHILQHAPTTMPELQAAAYLHLGQLTYRQGKLTAARSFLREAHNRFDQIFGPATQSHIEILNTLAKVELSTGNSTEAAELSHKAFAITEKIFGPSSPQSASAMTELAAQLQNSGRHNEANAWQTKALPNIRKHFGLASLEYAHLLSLRAEHELRNAAYSRARKLQSAAIKIYEIKALPQSGILAIAYSLMARIEAASHNPRRSLAYALKASQITSTLRSRSEPHFARSWPAPLAMPDPHTLALNAIIQLQRQHRLQSNQADTALREADQFLSDFAATAITTSVFKAKVTQAGHRTTINALDAASFALAASEETYINALQSHRPESEIMAARSQARKDAVHFDRINRSLPAALLSLKAQSSQAQINLHTLQSALRSDEIFVAAIPLHGFTFMLAATREAVRLETVPVGKEELALSISKLRTGLDPTLWNVTFQPFDRALAHRLYRALFAGIEDLIRDKNKIVIAAAEPLTSLPFATLVRSLPHHNIAGDSSPSDLRATAWLARTHTISTVPSVRALISLRTLNLDPRKPAILGIGAPTLAKRSVYAELPQAHKELESLRTFDPNALLLTGAGATVGALTPERLMRHNTLVFATHTATGPLPGLLMASDTALGPNRILSPDEIAALQLDADWVILSACNTATSGGSKTQNLATAFFQAGARATLVSHWPVYDSAAANLVKATLEQFERYPASGHAVALQQAQMKVLNDTSRALNAHPSTWAAFSLIGGQTAVKD